MKILVLASLLALQLLLSACSLLSTTRSATSEGRATITEAQETMRFLRQTTGKPDKRVLVTLVGGHRLNMGSKGAARPVKVCVYLSTASGWTPPIDTPDGECITREREPSLLASERRVLAPEQLLQLSFTAPGARDSWVVVDADFGDRSADYRTLRLPVENQDLVQVNAWLDNNRVNDASVFRTADSKP